MACRAIDPDDGSYLRHLAHLLGPNGEVSALCFSRPHAIDMTRASWTNRLEAVTCPRCRHLIKTQRGTA